MGISTITESSVSPHKWLYVVAGLAALILGLLLLMGMVSLIADLLQPDALPAWLLMFQDNWLILLFKLNAGFAGVGFDQLVGLNKLDMAILAFVAVMFLGLYTVLRRTSRTWSFIAAVMPFLGMAVFSITKIAGRSGVMGAGLIISLVMWRSKTFARVIAIIGLLACALLLVGDFGTASDSKSILISSLVGFGYLLLMVWFFSIGRRLIQLGKSLKSTP